MDVVGGSLYLDRGGISLASTRRLILSCASTSSFSPQK
jgi:hypothetical protein